MTDIERLRAAIRSQNQNLIAQAIIYFEKQDPTIAESVTRALEATLGKESASDRMWRHYDLLVERAVEQRITRVGEKLWFSKY